MNLKTCLCSFLVVGGLVLVAGCATPSARLSKHPELFGRLTPQQQQLIREGRVELGFDMAMVKLALGDPDRIIERTDANGKCEVWSYVQNRFSRFGGWNGYYGGYPSNAVMRRGGDRYTNFYPSDSDAWRGSSDDRVIFQGDKVVAIEVEKIGS